MNLDELRDLAHPPGAAGEDVPLLRLDTDEDLNGLVRWFGEDRERHRVNLVVEGDRVGYVDRTDVYDLFRPAAMGVGDSGRATLPGTSTGWQVILLTCSVRDCPQSPVYVVSFDPDHPTRCLLHDLPLAPG